MRLPRLQQPLIAAFLAAYTVALALFWWNLQGRERVDFPTYFHAARVVFLERGDPYVPGAFASASQQTGQRIYPFIYPPPSLLSVWPLAYLSYPVAKGAFTAVNMIAYLVAIWLLLVKLTPFLGEATRRHIAVAVCAGYLAIFHASIDSLRIGQINQITLVFICLVVGTTFWMYHGTPTPW